MNNERILLWPEVKERTGLSRTTVWREVRAQRFPEPVALTTHRVGWLEAEVQNWIAARRPKHAA
jgi:prophage regulatory protein